MLDIFEEQIVRRRYKAFDIFFILLVIFLGLMIITGALLFLFFLLPFVVIGVGYGAWWLITSRYVEFEYMVTNGDIDIDQITAKRRRNRLVSVAGRKIESLQPYNKAEMAGRKFDRKVMAISDTFSDNLWCFTYRSKKNGHTLVVFEPEQRILDALLAGLSPMVQREARKYIKSPTEDQ